MKKSILTLMLMGNLMTGFGQQNMTFQTACHPEDVKHYDTKTLRERFVMEKVMAPDEINLTYSYYDRFIYGGAMPVNKDLKLETHPQLRADYFMRNRELGIINTGGDGVVIVDGQRYYFFCIYANFSASFDFCVVVQNVIIASGVIKFDSTAVVRE